MKPPIIVIGAHRSGTSAVISALRTMGVFTGHPGRLDANGEPLFFLHWHEAYLQSLGGSWHQPEPLLAEISGADGFKRCAASARQLIHRGGLPLPLLRDYAGRAGAASLLRGDVWGWKDPRNVLFLDVWLNIFPNARIVHVLRHPLDVAMSLVARQKTLGLDDMTHAPHLQDMDAALELVQLYVERGVHYRVLREQYHELHYQDLQRSPQATLRGLAHFCDLPQEGDFVRRLEEAANSIETDGHGRSEELTQGERERFWGGYPLELRFGYE